MSESHFFKSQVESFLAAHPKDQGWLVYDCSIRLQYELSMRYLLDFLRDRHPDVIQKRLTLNEVRTPDFLGTPGDSHEVIPGSEWDVTKDLDIHDWSGSVELEWDSHPIHCLRFMVRADSGRLKPRAIMASMSNASLRSLRAALDVYVCMRENQGKQIMVVNGANMPIPPVSWEDLFLAPGMAEEIRTSVEAFFKEETKARYKELGISYRRGYIFTGPPGCGKTMALKALANSTNAAVIVLHVRARVSEEDLEQAFYLGEKYAPAILIFEDLDRLVQSNEIGVSHFLNIMDGLALMEGILVIATSNHPERLDQAFIHRPSRFDRTWRFALPNEEQRLGLLKKKGGRYFSPEVLAEAARRSNGFSMAYTQELVIDALLESIKHGGDPKDEQLLRALDVLSVQRKSASKQEEAVADRERIGFSEAGRG